MKCPGQDMKYWKADAIFEADCPECGAAVEFYKDDTNRTCSHCGHRFVNPQLDFGCAAYCRFAEQCLGTLPAQFTGTGGNLLKDRVAVEVKRFFHTDFKRIREATCAARHAEQIGKSEDAALVVVLCAAYLHALDDSAARTILGKVGAEAELTTEILNALSSLENPGTAPTLTVQVLHDALAIEQIRTDLADQRIARSEAEQRIGRELFTTSAKRIAGELIT